MFFSSFFDEIHNDWSMIESANVTEWIDDQCNVSPHLNAKNHAYEKKNLTNLG